MKIRCWAVSVAALLWLVSSANAHFVWLITQSDANGKQTPHVLFGEGTEPGEAELLDKVAQTKAWLQRPGAKPQALSLTKQVSDELGSWTSDVDAAGAVLFATCDYGVLDKGGKTFLLQYYAKQLNAQPELLKSLARVDQLPLDIVPSLAKDECQLVVLWQGQPVADAEVTISPPIEKSFKAKTDSEGKVSFKLSGKGDYAIRAKHVINEAGEREGKKYPSQTHYSTLVLSAADR